MEPKSLYSDYYSIAELKNGKVLFGGNFGKVDRKKRKRFASSKRQTGSEC
jgi:hypothetical protein